MRPAFELVVEVDGLPPAKGAHAPLSSDHPHLQRTKALLQAVRALLPSGFKPLAASVGLELTVRAPSPRYASDATNYLGGIADVLQDKSPRELTHLGGLALVSVYENDRVIREVRYAHEPSDKVGYRVRIWTLDRPELEAALAADQGDRSVERPPQRSPELCINFVNTLHLGTERLGTYQDLLLWSIDEGIVTPEIADVLRLVASFRATEAERLMIECRRFRGAIRGILLPEPSADALEQVSAVLRRYLPQQSLRWIDGSAKWVWRDRVDLERVLWPVAQSVLALVSSPRRKRVRACVSCKELFVDTSRNNRRRWCHMRECGNRAKGRHFQTRKRARHARRRQSPGRARG
jgi:hypothetical protein